MLAGRGKELIHKEWPGTRDLQWEAVNGSRPKEGTEQCYGSWARAWKCGPARGLALSRGTQALPKSQPGREEE